MSQVLSKFVIRSKYNDELIAEFISDLTIGAIEAVYKLWDNSTEDIGYIQMLKKFHPTGTIIETGFLNEEWLRL